MTEEKNMARLPARVQWSPSGALPSTSRASRGWTGVGVLLALALVAMAWGCGSDAPGAGEGGEVDGRGGAGPQRSGASAEVVASIFPVADLVQRLAGAIADVSTLLGPAASPATFDPTPRAVRQVQRARLLFTVGGGLDAWTVELLRTAPEARSVSLLEGVPLRGDGHGEGTGNPHVWLDPVRTRDVLVPRIADALAEAFPDRDEEIRRRESALTDSLTVLEREIRQTLASLPHRTFVASHAAWTYYAERFDLDQVGVVHEHPGQESSPQGLANLVRRAREAEVPVVFSEVQIPDVGARALAAELGVPVIPLDPLGGVGVEGRDSYFALLRYNTGQFVLGLGRVSGGEDGAP